MTTALPLISDCAVTRCAFNDRGCRAPAITVNVEESCATFIPLGRRGGLEKVVAEVGACQSDECKFNKDLVCTAPAVRIGSDGAECLTFERA